MFLMSWAKHTGIIPGLYAYRTGTNPANIVGEMRKAKYERYSTMVGGRVRMVHNKMISPHLEAEE